MNAASQARELQRAAAELEKFANSHPNSPQRTTADFERANLHLDKARAAACRSHLAGSAIQAGNPQKKARKLIDKSRAIFQTVFDRSKADYEKFPRNPSRRPQGQRGPQPGRIELHGAQIMLGVCSYEQGRTYDPKSDDFKKLSTRRSNSSTRSWSAIALREQASAPSSGAPLRREGRKLPRPSESTASSRKSRERAISSGSFATTPRSLTCRV